MHDTGTISLLRIHIILGVSNFAWRMEVCMSVDQTDEPFAEQTKKDWGIMSSGRESDLMNARFTKTSVNDDEKLCDTDVLGSKESHYKHDDYVTEKGQRRLVWKGVSFGRRRFTLRKQRKW